MAASKSPFGSGTGAVTEVYLNLTPLMDVMSNILFFLLASFGASAVAMFSVSVPIDGREEAASNNDKPEDKVTLTMRIEPNELVLSCQNPAKLPDALKVCDKHLPTKGSGHDLDGLVAALKQIKQAFPEAKQVVVVPHNGIRYKHLVGILDHTRDIKEPSGLRLSLFPQVVLGQTVE